MAEYKIPKTEEDLSHNFAQLEPIMDANMADYASARCLFCYDAPCVTACPTGIDIPLFIRQIRTRNTIGAAKTIYDANYFGQICGKVCPTEVLCEGACVYNESDVEPVEIGALQTYACNTAIHTSAQLYDIPPDTEHKVAIIGAGPAGIACACELRRQGVQVDIFEAHDLPSGLAVYGTAPYKITNGEVLDEVEYLRQQFGFTLHTNHPIESAEQLQSLEDKYDAIFLGIGLGETRQIHIAGEHLKGCHGAVEFIETVKINPLKAFPGQRVVVIGGGNTAMDAASESARLGAEQVTIVYRRSQDEMRAYGFEYDLAKGAGVKGSFNATPIEILGTDKVEGIRLRIAEQGENTTEHTLTCDAVIIAAGQHKRNTWLSQIEGLQIDEKGCIIVDDKGQTTHPKYFAGGDAVNGGAEVVNAAAEGKRAGKGIWKNIKLQ